MGTIYFSPVISIMMNKPAGTLILGQPGQGKSWLTTTLAVNEISNGRRVIALDPKNDLLHLNVIDPNVKVVDVNNVRPGSLNPFVFLDECNSMTLKTIIELIVGGIKDIEADSQIDGILQDFINRNKRGDSPVGMYQVADYLQGRDYAGLRNIGTNLKSKAESETGKLIFSRDENVEKMVVDKDSNIVFSLLGLPFPASNKNYSDYTAEENLTSAIIYILTKKLDEILKDGSRIPTTLLIDEAHILFANSQMTNIVNHFLSMGRSLNVATVLTSQSVKHFPENIAQFIANKFIFRSSLEEAKEFLDKFDSTNSDQTKAISREIMTTNIANLSIGWCFFLDDKNRSGIIFITPQFNTDLLKTSALDRASGEREL